MPENILIYYPPNKPSNVIETLALEFSAAGHRVSLLTQTEPGPLHASLQERGIEVYHHSVTKSKGLLFYLRHFIFLVRFCRQHRISALQSHLQPANIVAVFAQFFIHAKTVIYRHHLIEPNKMSKFFDKIINRLSNTIVVPSSVIQAKMLKEEGVKESKIRLIPYVYDFSRFKTSTEHVAEIKKDYPAKLRVLLCGRFVPLKRNDIAIRAIAELAKKGKDLILLALDSGPELEACQDLVKQEGIEKHVVFIGYTPRALDYIAACDVLIHPSFTEASNNTVKEAALFSKTVIVCEGVGDFSDFIQHRMNGYLVNRDSPLDGMVEALEEIYDGKTPHDIGARLKETVFQKFEKSPQTIHKHLDLLVK